ncbi:Deoxynucleoside triphosphate triphosphohydrolase SAMHD1 [Nymphon striatum]|nr:Deoxynucleoside triphosphate triphosphohydrolase SAMHD1 [Nymphon striatum]
MRQNLDQWQSVTTSRKGMKKKFVSVFFDSVHGHMTFHPLCINIIDTPEFQRLRNIKQTSLLYYVYPGASHNRFEHSLGTAYLANALVSALKNNQPELNISDADVLCVTIAGLCHDVGHGPFSHTWERFMLNVDNNSNWKHEQASIRMVDYIIESNNLKQKFADYGLKEHDITFIKDLIMGVAQLFSEDKSPLNMRGPNKQFLYEDLVAFQIVANKRCGIDVDKWDYFLRDSHNLGMKCNYDYQRFILYARVINVEGEGLQICMRDKEIDNLYNMFYIRWDLNRRAYKHKLSVVIEIISTSIFHSGGPGSLDDKLLLAFS